MSQIVIFNNLKQEDWQFLIQIMQNLENNYKIQKVKINNNRYYNMYSKTFKNS